MRIAIAGGGIAGITAAHILSRAHDVTLFEKNDYLGGHTNTRCVESGPDAGTPIDTGFIVCNDRNYPLLTKFFAELDVELRNSEMSFGFFCDDTGFHYLGPGIGEFLRMPSNIFRPRFLSLALEQRRFNTEVLAGLRSGTLPNEPLGAYLARSKASKRFIDSYLIPLIASIWSSPAASALDFPLPTFARFFDNHGMLELSKRPQWKTVIGGSHTYVKKFVEKFDGTIRLQSPIDSVTRSAGSVAVTLKNGVSSNFDAIVLASHADESLAMLSDSADAERENLGSWIYAINKATLHADSKILPGQRRHWASWNYRRTGGSSQSESAEPIAITYYMNRLQGLRTSADYFVTLNDSGAVDPRTILYEVNYSHPIYTPASVTSQDKIRTLNGTNRTYYCGAYLGYGFHEDGVRSAVEVCRHFGLEL